MAQNPDEPLTLTVHSLPRLDEGGAARTVNVKTGRWKLLLLFLVCVAPVVLSYFMYYVVRPDGRRNYGELIDPQRPLPSFSGIDAAGRSVPLTDLTHQWLLISVADSACDAACDRQLYVQRQLREGLGPEKGRLDWVWLRTGDAPLAEPLKQATAAAIVLRVDEAELATWLQPAAGQRLADHLYVVDPMGNWMMRFPADADPSKIKSDLSRLMKASAFWDTEGRPERAPESPAANGG